MADRPRCYVASPLGFNEAGAVYYREHYLPALARVVEPVDPWAQVAPSEVERAREQGTLRLLWLATGRRNLELIRSAPLLAAWLDGQEVDSGTATEIGYAAATGARCFGLRSDLRRTGEEQMAVNLQVEATIEASGGRVVESLDALVEALRAAVADGL
ncbi:nucleoside 2-deoxyribosyltransferase [Conexibacter sp. CPCC 206217]|uniref:nucleoside 2-deoxyribosyltransferase n=1 Tax=Conexibacter sp. CPCC 206217 TaxID=3064574 RepID=UPI00271A7943|nr:nucleoside 2-deoxyribosyltransferase [Conexibacter sp. CPCC 206217]MDO8213305.1 nucleoside 2-deoxyribosyltransferase [Conexibacter sp. CPCC 206217]